MTITSGSRANSTPYYSSVRCSLCCLAKEYKLTVTLNLMLKSLSPCAYIYVLSRNVTPQ